MTIIAIAVWITALIANRRTVPSHGGSWSNGNPPLVARRRA